MTTLNRLFVNHCGRVMWIAPLVFILGSILIFGIHDQVTHIKEVFYCWLLVFFNAYIGIFIANQAIRRDFTGFMIWALLINGIRAGIFLILLLWMVKQSITNDRAFVLMAFYGYFIFLAVEIYGLHKHTLKIAQDLPRER